MLDTTRCSVFQAGSLGTPLKLYIRLFLAMAHGFVISKSYVGGGPDKTKVATKKG